MPPAKRAATTDQAGSTSPSGAAPRRSSRLHAKRTGSIDTPLLEQLTPTPRRRTTRAKSSDVSAPTSPTPVRGTRGGRRRATGARSPTSAECSDDGHEQLAEHDEAREDGHGHRATDVVEDNRAVELAAAAAEVPAATMSSSTAPPSPPRTVSVDVRCASGEDDVAAVSAAPARRSDGDGEPVANPSIPATNAADTAPVHDAPPSPHAPVSLPAPVPAPVDATPSLPPLNVSFEPTLPKAPVEPLLSLFAAASARNPLGLARPPSPKLYFPKTDLVPVIVPPAPPRSPKRTAPTLAPATPAPSSAPAPASQFAISAAAPWRIDLFATPRPPRQQQAPAVAAPATPAPASTPSTWSCFADWGGATPRPGALPAAAPSTPTAWPVAFTATAESPLGSPAGTPRLGRKMAVDTTPRPAAVDATPWPPAVDTTPRPPAMNATPRPAGPSSRPVLVPLPSGESATNVPPAAAATAVARSSLFSCAPVWTMAPNAKPVGVRLEFATALKRSFSAMDEGSKVESSEVAEPPTPRPKARPVPSASRAVVVHEEKNKVLAPVVDEMMVDAEQEDDNDVIEVESVGSVEVPSDDGSDVNAGAMDVDDDEPDAAPAPVPAVDVIDFTDSIDEADELESGSHQLDARHAFDAGTHHQLDGNDELLGSDEDSGAESDDDGDDDKQAWHDHHATPRQRGWGSDSMATPRPFPRASTAAHVPPPHRSLFSGAAMSWSDNDPVDGEDVDDDAASDGSDPIVLDDSSDEEQVDELVSPSSAFPAAGVPIKREPAVWAEDVPIKHEPPTWDEDVAMDEYDDEYASADEEDWAEEDANDSWAGHASHAQPAWTQPSRPASTEVVAVDSSDDEAEDDDGPIDLISSSPSPPTSPVRHRAPNPAPPVPPTPVASAPIFAATPAVQSTPAPVSRTPSAALLVTPVHEPPTKKVKLFTVPHVDALATPRPAVPPTAAARHAFGTAFTPPAGDRAAATPSENEPAAPEDTEEENAPAEPAANGGFLAGFLKGILSAWRPPSFF
ncbi:hypothetical protein AMAG_05381 [Allomyces macrogynus ATCC 38327]|uniref:Uncharacterized protein n=1 Tax=Allomyces macrogynus (strain ATCC 38327) TaxID=578462 RepID=A0A0L0SBW2_ALLM3|nr:hypothetical protein AMAG_05381 [Allomyces macrogynus ATCC 38327]|eukprot:KNE59932.1 hypothetical protein AMAG_05381 [Allomyces macrogynus ATCC 38327]